jgi:hypothetical protein
MQFVNKVYTKIPESVGAKEYIVMLTGLLIYSFFSQNTT